MFSIALKKQPYQTYILTDLSGESQLEVVPERGGIITSWLVKGQQMLYMDRERFADSSLSIRGGIPILFPICGNLPNNLFTYQDKEYTLKQHGFARDLPWQVCEQITDNKAGIVLALESNEQTRACYPFDFKLEFTYSLKGNAVEIFQRYTNLSDQVMPFSTGLHPYFWTPDKTELEFFIPAVQYFDQVNKTRHSYHGYLDLESSDELDLIFPQITGLAAYCTDYKRRLKLTVSFSSAYCALVFWTVKGKEYYCLEPWSAPRNALNSGNYLIRVQPGATYETIVRLSAVSF